MTDPNHAADARQAGVAALADALARELAPFRYVTFGVLGRAYLERIARRQLAAVMTLPLPTRAALLGEP